MQSPAHGRRTADTTAIGRWEAADGRCVALRPLDQGLAAAFESFVRQLSERSRTFRFLAGIRELPADLVRRLTSADQRQHVAWVVAPCADPDLVIAEARYHAVGDEAEIALAVTDEWQRHGVGANLMQQLLHRARASGIRRIWGHVRSDNRAMIGLARRAGFAVTTLADEPGILLIDKRLAEADADEHADRTRATAVPARSMRSDIEAAVTGTARWLRQHWLLVLAVVLVPGGGLIAAARGLIARSERRMRDRAGEPVWRYGRIRRLLARPWVTRRFRGSDLGNRAGAGDTSEAFVDSDPYLVQLVTHTAFTDRRSGHQWTH